MVSRALAWAGLVAGPTAWALSTQINYTIATRICAHAGYATVLVTVVLALLAAAGSILSWQARRAIQAGSHPTTSHADAFGAIVSAGAAALFTLVILLQGVAGLVFYGCEF